MSSFGGSSFGIQLYCFCVSIFLSRISAWYDASYSIFVKYIWSLCSYGQTGTGKTFTMEGEKSSEGGSWDKVCNYIHID
jgi:Cdc6-like AAA superfamily ATPase